MQQPARWRRDQFLKPPKFTNFWTDDEGRQYMFVGAAGQKWALLESDQWDEGDILGHVRSKKGVQLPNVGDTYTVKRGDTTFKFLLKRVFLEVGRRRSKPVAVQPL